MTIELGRNDVCHCGSGKKYKKCHLDKDEQVNRKEREKAALNAAKVMAENAEKDDKESGGPGAHKHDQKESWMGKVASKMGFFQKTSQVRTQNKGG